MDNTVRELLIEIFHQLDKLQNAKCACTEGELKDFKIVIDPIIDGKYRPISTHILRLPSWFWGRTEDDRISWLNENASMKTLWDNLKDEYPKNFKLWHDQMLNLA